MKNRRGKSSIFEKIFLPLLGIGILQIFLLYVVFSISGIINTFDKNAKELLVENTRNKYQNLQTGKINEWIALSSLETNIDNLVERELAEQGKNWDAIRNDAELNKTIIEKTTELLIDSLRKNKTTGIFLILDGAAVQGDSDSYAGMYIRNRDPLTETNDNSDLALLRGFPPKSVDENLPLEAYWKSCFSFEGERENADNNYFYYPLDAAKQAETENSQECCYWGHVVKIGNANDISVVTYSIPLIGNTGDVYGVLGVEISTKYFVSQIYQNSSENYSFNYIGITTDNGKTYQQIVCSDPKFDLSTIEVAKRTEGTNEWMIETYSKNTNDKLQGAVFPLKLYYNNAPHSEEQWALIGFQEDKIVCATGTQFRMLLNISFFVILLLNILVVWLSAYRITLPIRKFAQQLNQSKDYEELELAHTNVTELDILAKAIMEMKHGIIGAAKRSSKLIELSGLPVGVFEVKKDADVCYCSDGFYKVLHCEKLKKDNNLLPIVGLIKLIKEATQKVYQDNIYEFDCGNTITYIRIITQQTENITIGTIMDVTKEIEERKRIEHERDYDLLTGIWNRRAFEDKMVKLFEMGKDYIQQAAMVMLDLDNLKAINDVYGHDCGDKYIHAFAQSLSALVSEHAFVARRSGDEFYIFYYGFSTQDEVLKKIKDNWEKIKDQAMTLPDGTNCKIRASAGYSLYPQDAEDIHNLIHYADFAMYQAKQTLKGNMIAFNMTDYNKDAILFNGHEALNRFIDQKLVKFMFQPIVSAKSGRIFGYEILMRSQVEELKTPDVVLRMAKSQGKLNYIEKMTWFEGLSAVEMAMQNGSIEKNVKIFINSIANQLLLEKDEKELVERFKDIMPFVVTELTEGESNNLEYTKHKVDSIVKNGGIVAIDDYGSGYNSELALVMIPAQIVKIDMTFVRDVDKDTDKQVIIKNLITFARKRGIEVLAEGVETKEEMKILIKYGVDYFQGYYIGRPQYIPQINQTAQEEIKELNTLLTT